MIRPTVSLLLPCVGICCHEDVSAAHIISCSSWGQAVARALRLPLITLSSPCLIYDLMYAGSIFSRQI